MKTKKSNVKVMTTSALTKKVCDLENEISSLKSQLAALNSVISGFRIYLDKDQGVRLPYNPHYDPETAPFDESKYEKIPYWMRPDFKMPPVMCGVSNKVNC